MLFLKGVILTQQGKREEAIDAFTTLTKKHPTLPEAYNNLAVLYAAEGQYEKARVTLEAGLRTHPAYATTYENLGSVYAKLSSQAYEKALQTKSPLKTTVPPLALLRALSTDATAAPGADTRLAVAPQPPPVPPLPAATAPPQVVATAPKTSPGIPDNTPSPDTRGAEETIAKTLDSWAAAWSDQDIKKYLRFYARDFKTPRGKSRKAWEAERRLRIVGKRRISVKVRAPQISFSGNTAKARFRQTYSSNRFSSTTGKTMIFIKEKGEWKIRQEMVN
jgi:tetratricopeptide (TPR) repeat protein